mgnify:CR=1 FL=1
MENCQSASWWRNPRILEEPHHRDHHGGSGVLDCERCSGLWNGEQRERDIHAFRSFCWVVGIGSVDNYGDLTTKTIELSTLQAASVYPFFSGDLAFMNKIGATIGDQNAAFDTLRARWADLDTSIGYGRFYPDIDSPSSYVEVQPGQGHQWIQSLDNAAVEISRSPLLYDLSITVFVV